MKQFLGNQDRFILPTRLAKQCYTYLASFYLFVKAFKNIVIYRTKIDQSQNKKWLSHIIITVIRGHGLRYAALKLSPHYFEKRRRSWDDAHEAGDDRPIANMATISPKRAFSVATVARDWLPVFYLCRCWKDCSFSDVFSFKIDKNKSIFFAEKGFNLVYTIWILFFYAKLKYQLTHSDHRQSHLYSDRDTLTARYFSFIVFKVHM